MGELAQYNWSHWIVPCLGRPRRMRPGSVSPTIRAGGCSVRALRSGRPSGKRESCVVEQPESRSCARPWAWTGPRGSRPSAWSSPCRRARRTALDSLAGDDARWRRSVGAVLGLRASGCCTSLRMSRRAARRTGPERRAVDAARESTD